MSEIQKKKILVVDDDQFLRNSLETIFSGEGHDMQFALDGQMGYRLFHEMKPDVIFLDLNMPHADGLQFLEAIDLKPQDPWAVIILTGERDTNKIKACYDYGITHFLHKPFSIYELKAAFFNSLRLKDYTMRLEKAVEVRTLQLQNKVQELQQTQQRLFDQRKLESHIATLSTQFLGLTSDELAPVITLALRDMATLIKMDDCSFLYLAGIDDNRLYQYDFSRLNRPRYFGQLYDWLSRNLDHSGRIVISDADTWEHDDPHVRSILQENGVKALMAQSITHKNEMRGIIFFAGYERQGADLSDFLHVQHMFGDLLVNLIERMKADLRLIEVIELKEHFIAAISHELRTPITVIKDGVGMVADGSLGELNEEQDQIMKLVKENVDRLSRLVNKVLDYRRLEVDQVNFERVVYDLNDLLNSLRQTLVKMLEPAHLELKWDLDPALKPVFIDKDWLSQVVLNLVSNAVKFTPEGYIMVSTKANDKTVALAVEDTGIGIARKDFDKLFQKFSQLGESKDRKTGGSGLGLAISRDIIRKHGGDIEVISEPGKGSTFIVTLPWYQIEQGV